MAPALPSRCPRTGPELAGPLESGGLLAHVAQSAEHFLGKEEVSSSNLDVGSIASSCTLTGSVPRNVYGGVMYRVADSFGWPFQDFGWFGKMVLQGLIAIIPIVGWIAVVWIACIAVLFVLPQAAPGNTLTTFNYAPVAVAVVLIFAGGYWFLSAKNWFKGPKVQGSADELARIEADLEAVGAPMPVGAPSS